MCRSDFAQVAPFWVAVICSSSVRALETQTIYERQEEGCQEVVLARKLQGKTLLPLECTRQFEERKRGRTNERKNTQLLEYLV